MAAYKNDIFLSHNSVDKEWVEKLARDIESDTNGKPLKVFFDKWDLHPGSDIPSNLSLELQSSRYVGLVMSPEAFTSHWVSMELSMALYSDPGAQKRVLIPLLRRNCDNVPLSIKRLSRIDFIDDSKYDKSLQTLIAFLRDRSLSRGTNTNRTDEGVDEIFSNDLNTNTQRQNRFTEFLESEQKLAICSESLPMQNWHEVQDHLNSLTKWQDRIFFLKNEPGIGQAKFLDSSLVFIYEFVKGLVCSDIEETSFYKRFESLAGAFQRLRELTTLSQYASSLDSYAKLLSKPWDKKHEQIDMPNSGAIREDLGRVISPFKPMIEAMLDDQKDGLLDDKIVVMNVQRSTPLDFVKFIDLAVLEVDLRFKVILYLGPISFNMLLMEANPQIIRLPVFAENSSNDRLSNSQISKLTDWYFTERNDLRKILTSGMTDIEDLVIHLVALGLCLNMNRRYLQCFNIFNDKHDLIGALDQDRFGNRSIPIDLLKLAISLYKSEIEFLVNKIEAYKGYSEIELLYYKVLRTKSLLTIDVALLNNSRNQSSLEQIIDALLRLECVFSNDYKFRNDLRWRIRVATELSNGLVVNYSLKDYFIDVCSNEKVPSYSRSTGFYILGFMMNRYDWHDKAILYLEKAYSLNDGNVQAVCLLAYIKFSLGSQDNALRLLETAVSIDSEYQFTYYYKGIVREKSNMFHLAAQDYFQALDLNPRFFESSFNLVNCLIHERCFKLAIELATYCHLIKKDDFGAFNNVAAALADAGCLSMASAILTELDGIYRDHIIKFNLGLVLIKQGKWKRAKQVLREAQNKKTEIAVRASVIYDDLCRMKLSRFQEKYKVLGLKSKVIDHSDDFGFEDNIRRLRQFRIDMMSDVHSAFQEMQETSMWKEQIRTYLGTSIRQLSPKKSLKSEKQRKSESKKFVVKNREVISVRAPKHVSKLEHDENLNCHKLPSHGGG